MSKFAEACVSSYENWEKSFPDINSIPDPLYSKKHIREMNKLFDRMRGNTYHRFTRKASRAILVAALVTALILCAFAVPSSRKYVVERRDGSSIFSITEHKSDNAVTYLEVGYIPEGYKLVNETEHLAHFSKDYESADGNELSVSKSASSMGIGLNTEGGSVEEMVVGNTTYFYVTNSFNRNAVTWTKNDYIYIVLGNIPKEELIKIAENLN